MRKAQTLILLLVAYLAATWFPGPGLWLRDGSLAPLSRFFLADLGWGDWGAAVQPPQLLLAALLFFAGICSTRGAVRTIISAGPRFALMALAAWTMPLAAAAIAVGGLWGLLGCPASVALGMLIIASMPVANSSVGWSTSMGGSVPTSIALLVVGTAVSPVLTPLFVSIGSLTVGAAEETLTQTPWSQGMGTFFLVWVLLPVLLGVLLASRLSPTQSQRIVPIAKRFSFIILIVLNYLNGAACLPALASQPELLLWPVVGAATLVLAASGCGWAFERLPLMNSARSYALQTTEKTSLMLAIVMRNTGAALVFAGAALPEFASVSITIIAYTMLQHLWVGYFVVDRNVQPAMNDVPRTMSLYCERSDFVVPDAVKTGWVETHR